MKLLVTIQAHFRSLGDEVFYHHLTYERFWKRYLQVFDSVLVVARVRKVEKVPDNWNKITGPRVEFCALPDYNGPYQYLRQMQHINKIIRDALRQDIAIILRVPGHISTQVWKLLEPECPYGLEVIGDPWDVFAPGSIRNVIRPYARWSWTRNLKTQCKRAAAVAYVTEHILQHRYPAAHDAHTTYYSSIDLSPADLCADTNRRLETISAIPNRLAGNAPPVRLGFIGTFSQMHKLPHVHIKALAQCVARGANVTLDMIGDGMLLGDMKALARRLSVGDHVNFCGCLPGGKPITDAMETFDLFLNATASEGLPRTVIEAMSRGCPCIASNVGGIPELLEKSFLVPPGDAKALSEKILSVLNDHKSMATAVERNVRIARNYCTDILQPRREAFYQALRERTERYLSHSNVT